MPAEFLGKGWGFPVQPDPEHGGVSGAAHEESVRQAIHLILGTSAGERVMRPGFGCGLLDLVFAVNSSATAGLVAEEVRRALLLWEPRIDLLDVRVAAAGSGERLLVRISYQVRATNNVFNIVYPFYLNPSGA
jgi:phage baseplate assembly protein W